MMVDGTANKPGIPEPEIIQNCLQTEISISANFGYVGVKDDYHEVKTNGYSQTKWYHEAIIWEWTGSKTEISTLEFDKN